MKKIDQVSRALRGAGWLRAADVAEKTGLPDKTVRAWLTVLRHRDLVEARVVDGQWEYKLR